tara:strand:+ start:4315 stop:4524 length:210 start_codon:yes stop_codon:yes gene_type:complete
MTKITIDNVDYDDDNFTDEQRSLLNELKNNSAVSSGIKYQLHSLDVLRDLLTKQLKTSLEEKEIDTPDE